MSGERAPPPAEYFEWLIGVTEQLMTSLPTVEQLESELGAIDQVSSQEPGDEE